MKDNVTVQEGPWVTNILLTFNVEQEAVRRYPRAPGSDAGDRSLGRRRGARQGLAHQGRQRRVPAGRIMVAARERTREAARLLARHQQVARGGQAPAQGSRRSQSEGQARQPHHRSAVHAGRHLRGRPVEAHRGGDRAQPGRDQALVRCHEQRQLRRRGPEHFRLRRRSDGSVQHAAEQEESSGMPTRGTPIPSSTSCSRSSPGRSIRRSA